MAKFYEVTPEGIRGYTRSSAIVEARQETMLVLQEAGYRLKEIGFFLNRTHTTVIHGLRCAKARRQGMSYRKKRAS